MIIQIPHNFSPRDYQKNVYNCLGLGYKRALSVWHRRAGKDKTYINICAKEAFKRVGSYFYILPYYVQARRIVWEGIDGQGFRNLDHFHPHLVKRKDNQQMSLELVNGSFIRFLGSDNIDSIVGTNPVGVIFSEFSLHKIDAWTYLRPILMENGGWAMFNGTPRGKNHMYDMLKAAENDPEWFTEVLSIEDTGVLTKEQVEKEIANGMPAAIAKQEFYCSFEAAMVGAYYADQMEALTQRVTRVPHDTNCGVYTAWDLGIDDTLVIWVLQRVGREVHFIDLIADNGHGLDYYVRELQKRPYVYIEHYLPHDVEARELSSGKTRRQTLIDLGLKNIVTVPRSSVEDGINQVRGFLGRCWFDKVNCAKGVEALKQYRAKWNPDRQVYGEPIHDWSSHYADALRTCAMANHSDPSNNMPAQAEGLHSDPYSS